jgi:hypothetical protein
MCCVIFLFIFENCIFSETMWQNQKKKTKKIENKIRCARTGQPCAGGPDPFINLNFTIFNFKIK